MKYLFKPENLTKYMAYTLDTKDRKIYYLLSENARMSVREIGRRVGLSKTAVLNRINQMISTGYIKNILAITNFEALKCAGSDIFFKIHHNTENEKKVIEILKNNQNIIWSGQLSGKWDFFVQTVAKSEKEDREIFIKIKKSLGKILESYSFKHDAETLKINRRLFYYEKETGYFFNPAPPRQDLSLRDLDELDKKILSYVCNVDGSAPYSEISKKVGASMETTRNRLLALVKNGIIVRYALTHGYESHGLFLYFIFIKIKNRNKKNASALYRYLSTKEEIKLLFSPHSREEFYFTFPTASPIEVDRLVKEIRNKFPDIVSDVDTALITHEICLQFFPKALMKSSR